VLGEDRLHRFLGTRIGHGLKRTAVRPTTPTACEP
jgi:hypothetical protein